MSAKRIIMRVRGTPVFWDGEWIEFTAGMTIDGDGSPKCYHPRGSPPGLDFTANAGRPGNWWALATTTRKPSGMPLIQKASDPAPGFFISMTSLIRWKSPGRRMYPYSDPRSYIDSGATSFAVIPGPLIDLVKPVFMGCHVEMENLNNGKKSIGVCADSGPADHLGEGSMKGAKELGVKSDPKTGGTESPIILYRIRPGVPAVVDGETFVLQPS